MIAADWSLVDVPAVVELLDQESAKLGRQFGAVATTEDVQQEGLLLVATEAQTVRAYLADRQNGERNLRVWLRSRLYDKLRTPAQRASLSREWTDVFGMRAADALATVERNELLRSLLARVNEGQREAVALRYLCDLSEAETADVLGVPAGTVKSRCSRALATMREAISEFDGTNAQDHFVML